MSGYTELLEIEADNDIVHARNKVRTIASEMGFGITDVTKIVTAVSELVRNVLLYAKPGRISYTVKGDVLSLCIEDEGPGLKDLDLLMQEGYSTSNGLGLGLPGAKKLMDHMEIETAVGKGTKIILEKRLR